MRFLRSLGPATCLEPGEWSFETASGAPAVRCDDCGGISEIDRRVPDDDGVKPTIDENGIVAPRWSCPYATCKSPGGVVQLEAWGEDVLE